MNDPVQQLVDDHINISIVHRHLRKQMDVFQEKKSAQNLNLLLDIVDYLKNYPECHHHDLEDAIYKIMRPRIKELALQELLDELQIQHKHLRILSQKLQNTLLCITHDQPVNRDVVVHLYTQYLSLYEEHIHCENTHFLPIIEQYLSADELDSIAQHQEDHADPLFSHLREEAYQNLFQHITDMQLSA